MMENSWTQVGLERVIGAHLLPLTDAWDDSQDKARSWEQVFQFHAEQDNELFQAENESRDDEKVFVLVRHGDYFYSGQWVDPNDTFDMAILSQDYESALDIAEERLEGSPEDTSHLFDKAYALSSLGRRQEALKYYDKILVVEPDDANVLHNKAVELALLGRTKEAERYHDKALAVDPNHLSSNISKLHYLAVDGKWDAYFDQLETIIQIEPRDVGDRLHLAGFMKEKDITSLDDVSELRKRYAQNQNFQPGGPVYH